MKNQKTFWSVLPFLVVIGLFQNPEIQLTQNTTPIVHTLQDYKLEILTSNAWQTVDFSVHPAIEIEEGVFVNDIFEQIDFTAKQHLLNFTQDGSYVILEMPEMSFASSELHADMNKLATPQQIVETGMWSLSEFNIKMATDNGRIQNIIVELISLDDQQMTVSFTKEIDGQVHVFTQTYEARPAVQMGW